MWRRLTAPAVLLVILITGCGGSSGSGPAPVNPNAAEISPAGDIPDNQAFVKYSPPGADFSLEVPEGWARSQAGGSITFTDKLNSVQISSAKAAAPPSLRAAESKVLPSLAASVSGFANPKVTTVARTGGKALLITYEADGKVDPVTGKSTVDEVERYEFFHKGELVTLTLSAPKGSDNVDPWLRITDSLSWR